jgi:prepilin peptidase CpaA
MTTELTTAPAAPPSPADDCTVDRAFLLQMARVPLIAAGFAVMAWLSALVTPTVSFGGTAARLGPVVLICLGMVLAAVIDGWAFKVPNWLTLSLVVSGWLLGGAADLGFNPAELRGGFLDSLGGTALGFVLLFPILFIGGMGQGDVKMQMGFGAWVAVIFGAQSGLYVVLYAFCLGVVVGGVFGLVMMVMRRQFSDNANKFKEIFTDLRVLVTRGPKKAAERANSRRASWVRLPYGVPLCVGFVGYLAYLCFYGG